MELNILNKTLNVDSDTYHDKTEYEFWYIYFNLLNIRHPILTDKDCSILAHLCTLDIEDEFLAKNKEVSNLTKTAVSNLYSKYKQLAEKKFMIERDGGYYLHPSIITFQKYIKNNKNRIIKFTIPINICQ